MLNDDFLIWICLGLYISISLVLNALISKSDEEHSWAVFFILLFTFPAVVALLVVVSPVLIISSKMYYSVYPEKRTHEVDFFGTENAKERLDNYRLACNERSFLRRCLEGFGFRKYTGPKHPEFGDNDIE